MRRMGTKAKAIGGGDEKSLWLCYTCCKRKEREGKEEKSSVCVCVCVCGGGGGGGGGGGWGQLLRGRLAFK